MFQLDRPGKYQYVANNNSSDAIYKNTCCVTPHFLYLKRAIHIIESTQLHSLVNANYLALYTFISFNRQNKVILALEVTCS